MNEKSTTIVVSDLHVGGGPADPGEDHVYQQGQFRQLLEHLGGTAEGLRGDVELFINGDFLELAQVGASVYQLGSATYWCSEEESLQKLELILMGHVDLFAALAAFQRPGNRVTIAPGNHDVDLYWPRLWQRLREVCGPVEFAIGATWYWRYGGRLQIGHGHMFDPANVFQHWANPILTSPSSVPRLEMCPGTLFMVKFVNWLEDRYPFADNVKPVTALGRILWKESRLGLASVGWMLSRFFIRHPRITLGIDPLDVQTGQRLVQLIQFHDAFAADLARLSEKMGEAAMTVDALRRALDNEDAVRDFLSKLLVSVSPDEWLPLFDLPGLTKLAIDGDARTLAIVEAGRASDKEVLRTEARKELTRDQGPEIVIMGHTHQPDRLETEQGKYFNPGSWTRYVDLDRYPHLTLDDLRQEERFPYQLNYIHIKQQEEGHLDAAMVCFQEEKERV